MHNKRALPPTRRRARAGSFSLLNDNCPYRKYHPVSKYLHLELGVRVLWRWSSITFLAACDTSVFVFSTLYQLLRGLLVPRLDLVAENLALRQQLRAPGWDKPSRRDGNRS